MLAVAPPPPPPTVASPRHPAPIGHPWTMETHIIRGVSAEQATIIRGDVTRSASASP